MGSSSSKASRAAGNAARKYPARPSAASTAPHPPPSSTTRRPGPTVRPQPQASSARDDSINLDASDPDFARSLRSLGPVQPNPTLSPSSTFRSHGNASEMKMPDPLNSPLIAVLDARARLQKEAEAEFVEASRRGHAERQFLDVGIIRQILVMRDEKGRSAPEVERALGLKKGVVEKLGARGLVGIVTEQGRERREVDMV